MSDVFMSYAREDRLRAEILARALELNGWSVWWDRTIPLGKSFDRVIEEAIESSKCLVVLWSTASVISDWVKTEAAEGMRRGVLVPVLIEGVTIPLEFRRIQAANLCEWSPAAPNPEFDRVIEAVTMHVGAAEGRKSSEAIRSRNSEIPKVVPPAQAKFATTKPRKSGRGVPPRRTTKPSKGTVQAAPRSWKARLITSDTMRRTLEVHLAQRTHTVEFQYHVGLLGKDSVEIKTDGVVSAKERITSRRALFTGVSLDFKLEDEDKVHASRFEAHPTFFSGLKNCRLTVSGKELWSDPA